MGQKLKKGLFCNSEAEENRAPIWQDRSPIVK